MFNFLIKLIPVSIRRALSRMLKYGWFSKLFYFLNDLDDAVTKLALGNKEFYSFKFEGHSLVGNIRFVKGTKDEGIYRLIRTLLGQSPLEKGAVLLDVGANIGLTAIVMAEFAKPAHARVFAFEPGDQIKYLRENLKKTGNDNCVFPQELAMADRKGEMTLFTYHESIVDSRLYLDEEWQDRNPEKIHKKVVGTDTLDGFLQAQGIESGDIRLLKMDCQGAEPFILRGMFEKTSLPENMSVIMEFWPYSIVQQGEDPDKFLERVYEKFEGKQFYFFKDEGELQSLSTREEFFNLSNRVGLGQNNYCDIVIAPQPVLAQQPA
ncbi:MAG: FkbM family methyltransferase [Candidatus Nitronauta litoralis]|uniref:FkbM family methyltransferase n=1 Tax=Candidatus Nitronauta litoralis TaxID=2705533 RepID=A0A7T0BUP7_9BACT|nr:MAG: FkbM family methyltransferase [Candidatus Nitronauta litoralis]